MSTTSPHKGTIMETELSPSERAVITDRTYAYWSLSGSISARMDGVELGGLSGMDETAMSPCGKGMYPDEIVRIVDRYLPLIGEDRREALAKDVLLVVQKAEAQVLHRVRSRMADLRDGAKV